jgi:hypothetical protein
MKQPTEKEDGDTAHLGDQSQRIFPQPGQRRDNHFSLRHLVYPGKFVAIDKLKHI